MITAQDLDRTITFERAVISPAADSAGSRDWEHVATVRAQLRGNLPSRAERMDGGFTTSTQATRVRLRYRADITSDMRIVHEGRILQIVSGPVEIYKPRRHWMELMAEEYSSAGNPA